MAEVRVRRLTVSGSPFEQDIGYARYMGIQQPHRTTPSLLRITAEQLEAMAARGAFERLPRVELREGLLYQMNPQYFPHGIAKMRIIAALLAAVDRLDEPLLVLTETSVRVNEAEVPMPDISVVRRARYPAALPVEDVRLVAEVSDTTLADDLGRKRALYALGGIPEYWVVDVAARTIIQHWLPEGDAYRQAATVPFGAYVTSTTLTGLIIPTTALREDFA